MHDCIQSPEDDTDRCHEIVAEDTTRPADLLSIFLQSAKDAIVLDNEDARWLRTNKQLFQAAKEQLFINKDTQFKDTRGEIESMNKKKQREEKRQQQSFVADARADALKESRPRRSCAQRVPSGNPDEDEDEDEDKAMQEEEDTQEQEQEQQVAESDNGAEHAVVRRNKRRAQHKESKEKKKPKPTQNCAETVQKDAELSNIVSERFRPQDSSEPLRYAIMKSDGGEFIQVRIDSIQRGKRVCVTRDGTELRAAAKDLYDIIEGHDLIPKGRIQPQLALDSIRVAVNDQTRSLCYGKLISFSADDDQSIQVELESGDVVDYEVSDPDVIFLEPRITESNRQKYYCPPHPSGPLRYAIIKGPGSDEWKSVRIESTKRGIHSVVSRDGESLQVSAKDSELYEMEQGFQMSLNQDSVDEISRSTRVMVKLLDGGKEVLFAGKIEGVDDSQYYVKFDDGDRMWYSLPDPDVLILSPRKTSPQSRKKKTGGGKVRCTL